MQLVECVPNFSEGRDRSVIDAIAASIESVDGVALLDVDAGAATNRTVMTFVGPPDAVGEAAFRAAGVATRLIDMAHHHGEHPRMGALDVCPFVPVSGVTMDDCVALARTVGRRLGDELGIPVFLYGAAASSTERASLATVRSGEYEGLRTRPDRPDFGPATFNPRSGATAVGARPFLIAYNVNLDTRDRKLAHRVAQAIREIGTPRRDAEGKTLRDADGATVYDPGRFKECRAVGWYIPEYGRAQVSINLTDPAVTSLATVFDGCIEEASALGLRVTGSEIVGLVPLAALLEAGDHYLRKQGAATGIPERERIHATILSLGLDDVAPFDPDAKILEYRSTGDGPLVGRSVRSFVDEISSVSPAPGGGSVAALCGALGAALSSMVAALAWPKVPEKHATLDDVGRRAQTTKDWFLAAVDRDTAAFDAILAARRLPKGTPAELDARERAIADATVAAAVVPLEVMEHAVASLEITRGVLELAPTTFLSDAGVAAACALAAAEGASLNVAVNLEGLEPDVAGPIEARRLELLGAARSLAADTAAQMPGARSG